MIFQNLPLPASSAKAELGFSRWQDEARFNEDNPALAQFMKECLDNSETRALLAGIFGASPFLTQSLLQEPLILRQFLTLGPDASLDEIMARLPSEVAAYKDQDKVMKILREGKRQIALLIALADISGLWDLFQVTKALSDFAALAIDCGLGFLLRTSGITLRHPEIPTLECGITVIGMGKLGAGELNYSSDIDLIVLYDPEKIEYPGRGELSEVIIKLTRNLIKIIDERTKDGYVFRTDMRLRPDPGSTPVAISVLAAETYYEAFGQNWERAAMIKARPIAGDIKLGEQFLRNLRPFIWRRHLDFAAIEDIHSIKRQINAHKGGAKIAVNGHNIKLGRGGIREIEFYAQTQQLIWGGREPALRISATCKALDALAQAGHSSSDAISELIESYHYLRRLEHRLQMVDDKQTQTLPSDEEKLKEIALFSHHQSLEEFRETLTFHLQKVESHYAALFEDAPALGTQEGSLVFTGGENDPETVKTITNMGFGNAEVICSTIRGWHHGRYRATRSTRARELLTELTPAILSALSKTAHPDEAFLRLDEFLGRLPAGIQLFSLFYANPALLDLVAEIMGDAPRLAEHLSRNPALLDSVLAQGFFDPPPALGVIKEELGALLEESQGFEEILDLARRFANDHKFKIGVQMLHGHLNPIEAGFALSNVADCVLMVLTQKVEEEFIRVHGRIANSAFVVAAMGKLGGQEMSPTSDLDLILIYDAPADEYSDGKKPLIAATYFARLTQRLVNALSIQTGEGRLYEVDMRLRPSGNSGPVATSLEAFRKYQKEDAWTWEHMALTRARIVCGDAELRRLVEGVIIDTLAQPRDLAKLAFDVREMRDKMFQSHKAESLWEVKHMRGGMVDIEFIAQYLQLAYATEKPSVLSPNTLRVIERADRLWLLPPAVARELKEAMYLWSSLQAMLRLTIEGGFHEEKAPPGLKLKLCNACGIEDFMLLKQQILKKSIRIKEIFAQTIVYSHSS